MHIDIGAAAFWLMVAAIVLGGNWRRKHFEALRHETLRLLIEKNPKIDEAQLAELINPKPVYNPYALPSSSQLKPGDGYRAVRATGVIFICLAIGMSIAATWVWMERGRAATESLVGWTPIAAMLGIGLFIASGYLTKPPADENKNK